MEINGINKWKDSSCLSYVERVNVFHTLREKMSILSKPSMDSMHPYQNSIIIFHRNGKMLFKVSM